jgi:hypothetical protein
LQQTTPELVRLGGVGLKDADTSGIENVTRFVGIDRDVEGSAKWIGESRRGIGVDVVGEKFGRPCGATTTGVLSDRENAPG